MSKTREVYIADFDELVAHGLNECRSRPTGETNIVNGMPWSFTFHGVPITHESDDCYLMPGTTGTLRFEPGDQIHVSDGVVITHVKGRRKR